MQPALAVMRSLSIRQKLWTMAAVVTVAVAGLAGYCAEAFHERTLEARLATSRQFVEAAVAIADKFDAKVRDGEMDVEFAKMMAGHEIRKLRYDGSRYVFIVDAGGRIVMQPLATGLEGRPVGEDGSGTAAAARQAIALARRADSGYVEIDGALEPAEPGVRRTRLYVRSLPNWSWILVSGVPVDEARLAAWHFALGCLAAAGAVSAFVAFVIARLLRSLRRRLAIAAETLGAIARGDLSSAPEVGANDEIGALLRSVAETRDGLRHLVLEVRDCAADIALASGEIAAGSLDLSTRTERTVAHLERMSGSLHGSRQAVDASGSDAQAVAARASATAASAGTVVSQVVATMGDITVSTRKMAEIIAVIDAIAFQTNILALNASVEANRAGVQGRGFSVVAGEVRGLAQRCADAAQEIKALIGRSIQDVEQGSRLVDGAGRAMREIDAAVRDLSGIVARLSRQQGDDLAGFSGNVGELDGMSQQNAAMVEQTSAAAESLRQQAQRLTRVVEVFRLDGAAA